MTNRGRGTNPAKFHELHETLYTFQKPEDEIEILSINLNLVGVRKKPTLPKNTLSDSGCEHAQSGSREVYSFHTRGFMETPIFDGDKLKPGNVISGPAVIEETRTSIVLFNNQTATLDAHLNYIIEIRP